MILEEDKIDFGNVGTDIRAVCSRKGLRATDKWLLKFVLYSNDMPFIWF